MISAGNERQWLCVKMTFKPVILAWNCACHSPFCLLIRKSVLVHRILHLLYHPNQPYNLNPFKIRTIPNSVCIFFSRISKTSFAIWFNQIRTNFCHFFFLLIDCCVSKCNNNWNDCLNSQQQHRRQSIFVCTVIHRRTIIGFHTVVLKKCTHIGCQTIRNCTRQNHFNSMPSNRLNVCTANVRVFSNMWKSITKKPTATCPSLCNVTEMLSSVRCVFIAAQIWPAISSNSTRPTHHRTVLFSIPFA